MSRTLHASPAVQNLPRTLAPSIMRDNSSGLKIFCERRKATHAWSVLAPDRCRTRTLQSSKTLRGRFARSGGRDDRDLAHNFPFPVMTQLHPAVAIGARASPRLNGAMVLLTDWGRLLLTNEAPLQLLAQTFSCCELVPGQKILCKASQLRK
ncbi:hypothetical protein BDV95DRAFT_257149 [Massariosphaeria phaeospora]|uniref:Uncharacterized protein n=1 Tax=Massariosphaeria phaeospora TaxID=100035 RepID=A0A7C8M0R7_9PLEO|nr:hypothetical protein BDV95DRAFT_257149 [Massariosphaeria phaeospora]